MSNVFQRQMLSILESVKQRHSTLSREILSGLIIYLSLIYIFIVNPEILSSASTPGDPMPAKAILIATVLTSASATVLMGFIANLPLAVAPGLEVSTFFTFVLVKGMHLSWHQALAAVFLSGLLNIVLTLFSFRQKIVESIPEGLKASLLLAVGSFIALVGLKVGGIVDVEGLTHWRAITDFRAPFILVLGAAVCFAINTGRFVLPWGIILSVIICTAISLYLGMEPAAVPRIAAGTGSTFLVLDFSRIFTLPFLTGTLILFVIDFVGGVGKIIALTTHTSMLTGSHKVERLKYALFVDGIATTAGSLLGTSSLIAFVESRLGIEAGARTGISAIVCGVMMLSGLLYSGAFRLVPPVATAGILLYIGILLIRVNFQLLKQAGSKFTDIAIGVVMALAILATFQMDWAMFLGFGIYFVKSWRDPVTRRSSWWLGGVAAILGASVLVPLVVTL